MTNSLAKCMAAFLWVLASVVTPGILAAQETDAREYAVQPAVEGLSFTGSLLSGSTGNNSRVRLPAFSDSRTCFRNGGGDAGRGV